MKNKCQECLSDEPLEPVDIDGCAIRLCAPCRLREALLRQDMKGWA